MVGGRPVGRGQNLSHTDVGDWGEGLDWTGRLPGQLLEPDVGHDLCVFVRVRVACAMRWVRV